MPDDADVAQSILDETFGGTRYHPRMRELLASALQFDDPEFLCLVAEDTDGERAPTGLVVFGCIIGARLAAKVHLIAAVDPRVQSALLEAVRETCERSGERLVICESPHDVPFHLAAVSLLGHGFREEGRIEDFVTDGVALRLLVWRPSEE